MKAQPAMPIDDIQGNFEVFLVDKSGQVRLCLQPQTRSLASTQVLACTPGWFSLVCYATLTALVTSLQ
jgi:hypothetical protein